MVSAILVPGASSRLDIAFAPIDHVELSVWIWLGTNRLDHVTRFSW